MDLWPMVLETTEAFCSKPSSSQMGPVAPPSRLPSVSSLVQAQVLNYLTPRSQE